MSKSNKKPKKNKDKISPPCAEQCPAAINDSTSKGESKRFHEKTPGMSKNKENIVTSSEVLDTNTDKLEKPTEPPDSDLETISQLKNKCRAIKSNLNAVNKKYEDEKKEKERLYGENQELKSKLSYYTERELEGAKIQAEKSKKEGAGTKKSFSDHDAMEVDTNVCADSATMSKSNKKTKKSKDKIPPACAEKGSEPINDSTGKGKAERFHETTSGMNNNKLDIVTSSKRLGTNTNMLQNEPDPPESNLENENISQFKNMIRAMKSNLNAVNKKYEDEKKEKEKLCDENQDLKSKLSYMEKELEAAKTQIEKLKKEAAHSRKSDQEAMEVETNETDVWEQPVQKTDGIICEEKKDSSVEKEARGTHEESNSVSDQDIEMKNSFHGKKSDPATGLSQEIHQDNDGNWGTTNQKQSDEAGAWGAYSGTSRRSHPINESAASEPTAGLLQASHQDNVGNWHTASQKQRDETDIRGSHGGTWRRRQPTNDSAASGGNIRQESRRDTRFQLQPPYRNQDQGHHPRNEQDNKYDHNHRGRGRGRRVDDRRDHGQNFNHNINNHDRCDPRMRTTDEPRVVTEICGDLFDAPSDCALAHCVAEDMRMGSGIAVIFKQKFKRVEELLDQRKRQGQVAVLEHEGRYIYYLVTKPESTGKPTMETLERSLLAMREHVIENKVIKIAMPRIGCGLDRLEWRRVRPLIETTFSKTDVQITIYNINEGYGKCKPKEHSKSVSSERTQCPNYKKSQKKKGKNNKMKKKPEKYNKKGEKKRRN